MRKYERKIKGYIYIYFIYLFGKAYNRVNREVLREVLRMYDVSGKVLNGIKKRKWGWERV